MKTQKTEFLLKKVYELKEIPDKFYIIQYAIQLHMNFINIFLVC
jgi:hypothetical protein